MDIAAWLHSLGLGQYEQAFRDNDIDTEVLTHLTADDLTGLGVVLIGHRRKLLAAIAALRAGSVPVIRSPAEPVATSETTLPLPEAERRQLTVMFVDLVDSTALASRLDPEEMGELLRAYQDAVARAVGRFEGHVAKYMGDGVLAYFGYPRAHEDEAERAVRAGLTIVEIVRNLRLADEINLAVRIGIATGAVVVGELIGEGIAREQTVVGDTPNLAARLQGLAEPGTVVIGARTQQLVGALFDLADLGTLQLKGFPVPVQAWRVVGESTIESRFEALHRAGLTPLVGREHEIGLLLERWERAKEGEGQVVLLAGEPGIGKSRLVRALRQRLQGESHMVLNFYCSAHHQTSPLYPIVGLLERAAGFTSEDNSGAKLEKLETMVSGGTEEMEALLLIAELLSIPTAHRYPPLDMTPHRQKERTLEVLVDQLLGIANRQPVLTLYEDMHWADPTSLELVSQVVERVQGAPVLVLITFRPEFTPPWTRYSHVTSLTLSRLSRRQGAAMVDLLTGGKALPAPVLDQIVAKTDGVPLFLEELTRAVMDANLLRDEGDHYALAGALPSMAIPTTLQESLLARLDRLAPAREVAQIGAAIGREFSHELLAEAAGIPESELQAALDDLVEAGLVFRRGTPPQATYSFKHALVQDAAYATLVRGKRQRLHRSIARAIEQRFPTIVQVQPELLAHHYTEAGLTQPAIYYWLRAGQRAISRSAMAEAVVQLRKGLEQLEALPETDQRWRQELDLQVALGVALMAWQGWAAPEAGRANAHARELCERIGSTAQLWPVLYGEWVFHAVRAEHVAARKLADQLLRRAQDHQDAAAMIVGHRVVGSGALWRGELAGARRAFERTLALYNQQQHGSLGLLYVQDPRVAALSGLSWTLFALGYPEQAQARSGEALDAARELAHWNTLAYALLFGCFFAQMRRARDDAQNQAEALITLATEQNIPHFLGAATMVHGWALTEAVETQTGLAELRRGLPAWRATGAALYEPYFLSLRAEAHSRAGSVKEGLDLVRQALSRVEETGERLLEAELHRMAGELMLRLPKADVAGAEAGLSQAVSVARQQGAKMWEVRAAVALARLWIEQDRRNEARQLLTPLCDNCTAGFEAPDLQIAQAILRESTSSTDRPS